MGILYKLTFKTGKSYVGITTESLKRRVQRHIAYARAGRPYALSAAIRKYGEGSFTADVLAAADTWSELKILEIAAIREHLTICPYGYNMTAGGDGSLGIVPSVEKRRKISESLSGRTLSESHRRAVGDAKRGRSLTEKTIEKMREAHRNRAPMSSEQRAIRSEHAKRQHAARRANLEKA